MYYQFKQQQFLIFANPSDFKKTGTEGLGCEQIDEYQKQIENQFYRIPKAIDHPVMSKWIFMQKIIKRYAL